MFFCSARLVACPPQAGIPFALLTERLAGIYEIKVKALDKNEQH
jgi:hypothetical protein